MKGVAFELVLLDAYGEAHLLMRPNDRPGSAEGARPGDPHAGHAAVRETVSAGGVAGST